MRSSEENLRLALRLLMIERGERQKDVAKVLDIDQSAVSLKLSGKARWWLEEVDALAAHYGVQPSDLLCGPGHAVDKLPPLRQAALFDSRQEAIA